MISEETNKHIKEAEIQLRPQFEILEEIRDYNQEKVLHAFIDNKVAPEHFYTVSGYGHDDLGKEVERITLRHGSDCAAAQVPRNVYHTFIPLEDGTVIFEAKDRAYDPETMEVLECRE